MSRGLEHESGTGKPGRRSWFADRSVGTKITAVVVLGTVVSGTVLGVGLAGLHSVSDRASATYERSTVPSAELAGVRAASLQTQRDLANLARRARERTLDEHTARARAAELVAALEAAATMQAA